MLPAFISCGQMILSIFFVEQSPDGGLCSIAGLFDPNLPPEYIGKEIMKCLDLAKDGVHALLLVLSVRNRFTDEEIAAVESLQTIFGEKVVNYMVVVFTGGDELDDGETVETLEDFLEQGAPTYLRVNRPLK